MKINQSRVWVSGLLVPALVLGGLGCETSPGKKTAIGAIAGALVGAGAGAIIGHQSGNKGAGALIGAAAGAAIGGGIGYYLDKQAAEYNRIEDVEVYKVPEGPVTSPVTQETVVQPERIMLRMSNEVLFPVGKASLQPGGAQKIKEIADILNQYPESNVMITGHASSEGADATNLNLSTARAEMVRNTLISYGVNPARLTSIGLGSSVPIADNATEVGRAQNRRVEIEVIPTQQGAAQPAPAPAPAPAVQVPVQ